MQSKIEWILCPSKSFPGKFYYFNVRNGKAAWCPNDAEMTAGRLLETPKPADSYNHPNWNSPPAPDYLQHDFFIRSKRQTPDTSHEDTPFSPIHHPTADPIRQNFSSLSSMHHSTPVFGQNKFPRGLPKHEDSNAMWTPIQTQVHIPLQNQASTTFGAEYPEFRDHPNISDADRAQVSKETVCKKILVDASNIPMHQRFVNFEDLCISFSKVNKDNIKRLHQKLQSSTPIKKSRAFDDPSRLAITPKSSLNFADLKSKTGNSIIKEPVLNFGLFSNTNKQNLNFGLPTKNQDPRTQKFNVGPITTTVPVFNGDLTESREPLLSNRLPSKSMATSLKAKNTCLNFGLPSKITEPLLNLEPPSKTKQPILNAAPHSKTQETIFNFDAPLKDPYLNFSPKTKEPGQQYLNGGSSMKTKEPVFYGQASKPSFHDPVLNIPPTKTPQKDVNKEPKRVLKGCVKSLKSYINEDNGDNAVAKSFDDDLRAVLISKRKSQDFRNAEFQGSEPKKYKQEKPTKKKVTFNLEHECISMVSSLEDDEDMKCAFIELYRPTLSYLKALGPSSSQKTWFILADMEVLTKEFDFIDAFVRIDPTCKLLIPPVVHSSILALARGCGRPVATAARNVLRRTTSTHVVVQPCHDQDYSTCTNNDILRCCVENMDQGKHLILISDDLELLTTAKCHTIPCYSMNSIKNGLPAAQPYRYNKHMKITIRNDSQNIKNNSVTKKSSYDVGLNEKEKAIIRNIQMSKYPIGQIPGHNEKNPIKYLYHDENMRIAEAIEMYNTDSQNVTPLFANASGISNETGDISNLSTIQNESMDIEKSCQSINKENSNKVKQTAEAVWRFESEVTKTSIEDNIQKLKINDEETPLDTDETVSVFFKNQKPVNIQYFKYSPKMKISLKNEKVPEIPEENQREKDNQNQHFKNIDSRLEMSKSSESIFEFCKEKTKEPPTTEFDNGKTNMASQGQKIIFEFEKEKTNMAFQYDSTKFQDQNGKTNMSSQLDRSKSNMASTSNGFDVSKPQTMMNRIDLNRFYVKNKDTEHRLNARMDEWICMYTQIMEQALSSVLEKHSPPVHLLAPWSLLEALQCLDTAYKEQPTVHKIVGHLCSCLYKSHKMKKFIHPEEFMRALGCGAKLLEYLEIIQPSTIEMQDGVAELQALLNQIEDDTDPTAGLSEPLVTTPWNSKTDELDIRQNFVKDKSDVAYYLKKYFAAWKDYDPSQDIIVYRTRGKKVMLKKIGKKGYLKNEDTIDRNGRNNVSNVVVANSTTQASNVGEYCSDINNVDRMKLFTPVRDKNIGVRKESYGKKKTGAMDSRKNHVENNIDVYKPKKAKDGKVHDEKGPTIIRNVGELKELETKLRKRKIKPDYVDIKPVKKPKIYLKTARNDKIHNDTDEKDAIVNGNPKNTVYRPDKDPKLIYSPKVVIKANLISDYEEQMRIKKAKKLYDSVQTGVREENDNHSAKTDNKHNQYSRNSYNGINNNHNLTKNHKESDNSDHNDNQVTKIKNKKYNHDNKDNDNDDNNNNKDVTTDSGLGNELPRWSSVVDSYTADIEKSLEFILRNMNSAIATFREYGSAETLRMRAFEMDYLVCRILGMLRGLLRHSADEDDRAKNLDAVANFMAQAKRIHTAVNSILAVTNYLLPASSDKSVNV